MLSYCLRCRKNDHGLKKQIKDEYHFYQNLKCAIVKCQDLGLRTPLSQSPLLGDIFFDKVL